MATFKVYIGLKVVVVKVTQVVLGAELLYQHAPNSVCIEQPGTLAPTSTSFIQIFACALILVDGVGFTALSSTPQVEG